MFIIIHISCKTTSKMNHFHCCSHQGMLKSDSMLNAHYLAPIFVEESISSLVPDLILYK